MNPNETTPPPDNCIYVKYPPGMSLTERAARLRSTAHLFELQNQIAVAFQKYEDALIKHEATFGVKPEFF